jgi:WD40 repeat protein
LDAELDRWLNDTEGRVFLVTGDPGTGKSAYLAHVLSHCPQVAAHHFCVANLSESLEPMRFVESLAAQLAGRREDYRRLLAGVKRAAVGECDAGTLLRRLVADPLRQLAWGQPLLIVVDGLDEALLRGGDNIPRLLSDRLEDFPAWVRFVISTRKEPEVLDLFSQIRAQEIEVARPDNLRDVAAYLEAKLRQPALAELLRRAGTDPETTAPLISQKGEGNFLYVTQALEAIQSGQIDPRRPEAFPEGLVGIYQGFFERLFPRRPEYEAFRPLLDVMTAAREPLTAGQIAHFLDRDLFDVEADLQRVAVFFPERGGRIQVCHKSLSDWLRGLPGRSRTYRVNVQAGHRRIAGKLLEDYRTGQSNPFLLAHLPTHLLEAGQWTELEAVLTDLHFIEAKGAAGLMFALVADYTAALAVWPGHTPYDPFGPAPAPVPAWLRECTAAVLAGKPDPRPDQGAGPILARLSALPEGQRENGPQESRFQTEEVMPAGALPPDQGSAAVLAQMRLTEDAGRAGQDPAARDTPANRVLAFATFVSGHSHLLHQHPHDTIPLARNQAETGLVVERATGLAERLTRVWVARDQRPPALPTHPVCLRTLKGHTADVYSVSLSQDGKTAVSGSRDHSLRVWEVPSGECVKTLAGDREPVLYVCLTPDGQKALSAGSSENWTLRVWDMASGRCLKVLHGHIDTVHGISLSADGAVALSASRVDTLRVWCTATGECRRILQEPAISMDRVMVTPDGKLAVSGGWDGAIWLWDVARGKILRTLRGHRGAVTSVFLTPDGKLAASAGFDHTVRIWDVGTGTCLRTLLGHARHIAGTAMTADGGVAVSGSWDGSLRVWDVRSEKCVRVLHTSPIISLSLTPDGRLAATACKDQTVRIWDLATGTAVPEGQGHKDIVYNFAWTRDGARVISASSDQTLRIWEVATGKCLHVLQGHINLVHGVAWTPDGRTAVSTGFDNTLRVWDAVSGACRGLLKGHQDKIREVALSGDGRLAVSAGYDGTVRIWNLATRRPIGCLNHPRGTVSVALTSDGRRALSGGWDGSLWVWDIEKGECLRVLYGHRSWVTNIALTGDGRRAVSASEDNTLRVWDVDAGACLHTLRGHTDEVLTVTITPDGRMALSGSDDNTVRVWDLVSGRCLALYYAGAEVRSVSQLWADGHFFCGTVNGQMHRLTLRNLPV